MLLYIFQMRWKKFNIKIYPWITFLLTLSFAFCEYSWSCIILRYDNVTLIPLVLLAGSKSGLRVTLSYLVYYMQQYHCAHLLPASSLCIYQLPLVGTPWIFHVFLAWGSFIFAFIFSWQIAISALEYNRIEYVYLSIKDAHDRQYNYMKITIFTFTLTACIHASNVVC